MKPSMRLKSARPPGSGLSLDHCSRSFAPGEREFDITGCYRRDDSAASDREKAERPPGIWWPFCLSPARADHTLGGIVSVAVSPGRRDIDGLMGAWFEPIGSM